jgi:protein TonB
MIYPRVAVENGEQGRVTISFTVMKDGTVNDIKILGSSGSKALDKEAIRVVSSSPLWEPARQNNEVVTQVFVIPLIFMLQ